MNVLIVEGKDDVAFIKYIIQYLNLDNVDVIAVLTHRDIDTKFK